MANRQTRQISLNNARFSHFLCVSRVVYFFLFDVNVSLSYMRLQYTSSSPTRLPAITQRPTHTHTQFYTQNRNVSLSFTHTHRSRDTIKKPGHMRKLEHILCNFAAGRLVKTKHAIYWPRSFTARRVGGIHTVVSAVLRAQL